MLFSPFFQISRHRNLSNISLDLEKNKYEAVVIFAQCMRGTIFSSFIEIQLTHKHCLVLAVEQDGLIDVYIVK